MKFTNPDAETWSHEKNDGDKENDILKTISLHYGHNSSQCLKVSRTLWIREAHLIAL